MHQGGLSKGVGLRLRRFSRGKSPRKSGSWRSRTRSGCLSNREYSTRWTRWATSSRSLWRATLSKPQQTREPQRRSSCKRQALPDCTARAKRKHLRRMPCKTPMREPRSCRRSRANSTMSTLRPAQSRQSLGLAVWPLGRWRQSCRKQD